MDSWSVGIRASARRGGAAVALTLLAGAMLAGCQGGVPGPAEVQGPAAVASAATDARGGLPLSRPADRLAEEWAGAHAGAPVADPTGDGDATGKSECREAIYDREKAAVRILPADRLAHELARCAD
ncbi:MAG: hypothetical protein JWP66_1466 [Naasia sp.]|nr:hypothetical protein [Naasia sp.]